MLAYAAAPAPLDDEEYVTWDPDEIASDFATVAHLAGVDLPPGSIEVERMFAPQLPPTKLPLGRMAVYVFARGPEVLKVGKVGPKSQARYTSQHYNPGSAMSTLAGSILADAARHGLADADTARIGQWIRESVDRVNFLIDERLGMRVLTLLKAVLQCRLNPCYEGFKRQNTG
jgi:hypothetical protein